MKLGGRFHFSIRSGFIVWALIVFTSLSLWSTNAQDSSQDRTDLGAGSGAAYSLGKQQDQRAVASLPPALKKYLEKPSEEKPIVNATIPNMLPAAGQQIMAKPGEVSYSEKVSGAGSIKRDYYILNKANDSARVSVDIRNATYYEYKYGIRSDEVQCIANLDLVVSHAESIKCSGDATNRSNIHTNVIALLENGNLTYNNSVAASNHGVLAFQNMTRALGDDINAAGTARDEDNNIIFSNNITANRSESFQSAQIVSIGSNTSIHAEIDATTGPLNVSSYIGAVDRKLGTAMDVAAGIVSIDQLINPLVASQRFQGIVGGADFVTKIENPNGDKTHVYATVGSGNLTKLSQRASGLETAYELEYEYLPVSYSTGVYDMGYMEGGSEIFSNKTLASKIVSESCEYMDILHIANLNETPLASTKLNVITGPLKVESNIGIGDRKLNTTADVVAGTLDIDQLINLTEAYQSFMGTIGGASFDTFTTYTGGNKTRVYTSVGSGNLVLEQLISLIDARYDVDYMHAPFSYHAVTYDMNLNSSKIEWN